VTQRAAADFSFVVYFSFSFLKISCLQLGLFGMALRSVQMTYIEKRELFYISFDKITSLLFSSDV
jgi:hypothetical protein